MSTKYINVPANGTMAAMRAAGTAPEVVISFYGPRGGSQGLVSISLETARELRDRLEDTIQAFTFEQKVC